MAEYKISVYMVGAFKKAQVDGCFDEKPSLYLESGSKNAGGKIVDKSICNFVIKEGLAEDIFPVFEECYEKLRKIICGVVKLRSVAYFESRLSLVIRTDPKHLMPAVGLDVAVIKLLSESETTFDIDCYHYENLEKRRK